MVPHDFLERSLNTEPQDTPKDTQKISKKDTQKRYPKRYPKSQEPKKKNTQKIQWIRKKTSNSTPKMSQKISSPTIDPSGSCFHPSSRSVWWRNPGPNNTWDTEKWPAADPFPKKTSRKLWDISPTWIKIIKAVWGWLSHKSHDSQWDRSEVVIIYPAPIGLLEPLILVEWMKLAWCSVLMVWVWDIYVVPFKSKDIYANPLNLGTFRSSLDPPNAHEIGQQGKHPKKIMES